MTNYEYDRLIYRGVRNITESMKPEEGQDRFRGCGNIKPVG